MEILCNINCLISILFCLLAIKNIIEHEHIKEYAIVVTK